MTGVPSNEEMRELPNLAIVAFAARCARRVQPLLRAGWPDAPEEELEAVETAIAVAEQYSATGTASLVETAQSYRATETARAAEAVGAQRSANVAYAAEAAYAAARAAAKAPEAASFAAAGAAEAAARASDAARSAIRRDFDQIHRACLVDKWREDTSVPVDFFGAMWPNGAPSDWPA